VRFEFDFTHVKGETNVAGALFRHYKSGHGSQYVDADARLDPQEEYMALKKARALAMRNEDEVPRAGARPLGEWERICPS
jgi:hypothetical protein